MLGETNQQKTLSQVPHKGLHAMLLCEFSSSLWCLPTSTTLYKMLGKGKVFFCSMKIPKERLNCCHSLIIICPSEHAARGWRFDGDWGGVDLFEQKEMGKACILRRERRTNVVPVDPKSEGSVDAWEATSKKSPATGSPSRPGLDRMMTTMTLHGDCCGSETKPHTSSAHRKQKNKGSPNSHITLPGDQGLQSTVLETKFSLEIRKALP